jgi:hypothetical protein
MERLMLDAEFVYLTGRLTWSVRAAVRQDWSIDEGH